MHGGPGTGKSHVINVIKERLFRKVLKWEMGVEYQIVALQAVMADLLGGDAIHHACGFPVCSSVMSLMSRTRNLSRWLNAYCSGGG